MDDSRIPMAFVQEVAEILGSPIDERGHYKPPVGTVNLHLISPMGIAEQVLRKFNRLKAVENAWRRHVRDYADQGAAQQLARDWWTKDPSISITAVATRLHEQFPQRGFSTCRKWVSAVHAELGLPKRCGRQKKLQK